MTPAALPPLTHHEILVLVEPFVRSGHRPDLAGSDRVQRRLVFHAQALAGDAPALPPPDAARPLYDLHRGTPAMATHVATLLQRLQALSSDQAFASALLSSLLDSRRSRSRYRLPVAPRPGQP